MRREPSASDPLQKCDQLKAIWRREIYTKTTPFREWLADQALDEFKKAFGTIKDRLHNIQDERSFVKKVSTEYLHHPTMGASLLALCGKKKYGSGLIRAYFEDNYRFAKTLHKREQKQRRERVVRVFVEPTGGFQQPEIDVIESHHRAAAYGVVALVIPLENQKELDRTIMPKFVQRLQQGFGFLILDCPANEKAIAHAGFDLSPDRREPFSAGEFKEVALVGCIKRLFDKVRHLTLGWDKFKGLRAQEKQTRSAARTE